MARRLWFVVSVVVVVVVAMGSQSARAATAVTGAGDTTRSLEFAPDTDALTGTINLAAGARSVAFIQRMPVRKRIDQITVGDLANGPSCSSDAIVRVRLWRHTEPVWNAPGGTGTTSMAESSSVTLSSTYSRASFTIPAQTLAAGQAYGISLERVGGCGSVSQRSWAHNQQTVHSGPASSTCVGMPWVEEDGSQPGSLMRMWHANGLDDRNGACASGPFQDSVFDPSMPTGWLVTGQYASYRGVIGANTFTSSPPSSACVPSGVEWALWKTDTVDGRTRWRWVCRLTQFAGAGDFSLADGWYHGAPWRSARAGRPRDVYLKLKPVGSGPSEPELRGMGGTVYQAAPNLKRCYAGDPVNCATGNFTEVYTDLRVGGRGVGLLLERTYNSHAAAAGETGPFGYGWSFSFGESLSVGTDQEVTVRHDDGSTATFWPTEDGEYAAAGWVQSELVKRGDGSYAYTLPDQRVLSFTSAGRLEWVEDRNANRTTLTYSSGRLSAITDPGGRPITFTHNGDGTIATATDPAGHELSYGYTGGELSSVTDVGDGSTVFDYDGSHRMTSVTDARGKETTNVYDSQGRVTEQTDPLEHTMTWNWATPGQTRITDATGRVTVQHFSNNLPTSVTKGVGTAAEATWSYVYDEAGNTTKVTDPNSHEWLSSYDERGNRTSSTDALSRTTAWTYDGDRNVTKATIPGGRETRFDYDANGNLTSIERTRTETSQTVTTTLGYDGDGQLTSSTDPLNRTTTYDYNARGDRVSTTTPEGKTTTATYDDASRLVTLTSARGNETGAVPADFTTYTTRDAFGNPTDIEDPLGHHTLLGYDADQNLISATDRDGNETTYAYDGVGRQTTVTRADTSTLATGYDAAGRMTSQTDGLSRSTTYAYDGQGRVRSITDPLNRETVKAYDDAGNLTTLTDPQNRTTTYSYDAADRLTGVSYSSANPGDVTITYTAAGERNTVADDTGTTDYDYDSLGRLTSHTNGAGQTTGYAHDLAGQLASLDYPDALTLRDTSTQNPSQPVQTGTVDRDYDDDGNLVSVTDWLSHQATFDYDAEGHLTGVDRPNGTTASYDYDRNGALTGLTDRGDHTGLGRTADSLLASSTPPIGSPKAFAYDDVRRLTGAGTATYSYDDADNLTQTVGFGGAAVTQEFDAANQLTETSESGQPTATFDYDALGNRTERDAAGAGIDSAYGYDQAAQLVSYTGPNRAAAGTISESYRYDADGLRQSKTSDGIERSFAYDVSGGLPLIITDGPTAYITGPGGLPIEQITQDGTVRYFHHDQLGSTTALSNQSGATAASYEFDAYGNPVGVPPSLENPFGFAGQYTDAGTGLQYLRARYYDPATGQFITRDPLEAETREPYAYAGNSPPNNTDPSGEIWQEMKEAAADWHATLSNPAAALLHGMTGGLSTGIAGDRYGFDAVCADFGPGSRTLSTLGSVLPTGRLGLLARGARGGRAATGGTRAVDATLDASGKVHGKLPKAQDLRQYHREDLVTLRDQLQQSVQKRIQKTVELGADPGHSSRLTEEQALIKSIEKHLADR